MRLRGSSGCPLHEPLMARANEGFDHLDPVDRVADLGCEPTAPVRQIGGRGVPEAPVARELDRGPEQDLGDGFVALEVPLPHRYVDGADITVRSNP